MNGILMLTLCSFIWGTAFIAQSAGVQYMGPLTFNCGRSFLATLFLFPCFLLFDKFSGRPLSLWGTDDPALRRQLVVGGIVCGAALTISTLLQQIGIAYTTVGKSGFITTLYIVIVPLLGRFFLGRRVNLLQWLGVMVAAAGMYFICINEAFSVNKGDMFTLACSLFFAIHILCVERFINGIDGVRLSFIQFLTSTILNCILMFAFESPSIEQFELTLLPIFYAGVMSSGVAYTLQILGQKYVNVVLASILLSLESVFAVLSGWLILGQVLSMREFFGCALVFAAIILAQLPSDFFNRNKPKAA